MRKITAIIIGAGNRGTRYAEEMAKLPEKIQVVGVADPRKVDREHIRQMHRFSEDRCYDSWEEILSQPRIADMAVIATVDNMHLEPALRAIELGYDLLLEKPVAQTPQECAQIAEAARKKGVKVLVCHVLRYTNFYGTIKQLLMDGTIGEVISADLVEAVGQVHYSHSYVRGNWHNEAESTPMLLAKCCHDLDIIQWLLDKPCKRVHSFGSLTHFTRENMPEGAPERCADGNCPVGDTCPYNCLDIYFNKPSKIFRAVVASGFAKEKVETDEEVLAALKVKDYGKCVYQMNNDVVDHQVVSMEFEGGTTATLTMNAFSKGGRYIRLYGTKGELYANMSDTEIKLYTFSGKKQWTVPVSLVDEHITGGHGGGDAGIIRELYDYFSDHYTGFRAADIQISVRNHMIGFAAEHARHTGTVVSVDDYMREQGLTLFA